MRDGKPPMDLWDVDVRRTFAFQAEPDFLRERTRGNARDYSTPCTGLTSNIQPVEMRDLAPCTKPLLDQGAVMGELAGLGADPTGMLLVSRTAINTPIANPIGLTRANASVWL
jgi:hypothetical protein